jgi:hypothetical protein
VLNLALVFERHGQTPEFGANSLFRTQKLNRSLILKHALREHEKALFIRAEPHTTKIIFPYSPTELGLGGTSVMVGEKKFEQLLRKAVGASVDEDDFHADFELIALLHELPSFDPFLLREQLRRSGHEPAPCYFEISDADITTMLAFAQREIEPLVGVAFGAAGRRAEKLAMRMAQKLMTDASAQLLAPLRETMRLKPGEFAEGVFAWKGFLYYKWMLRAFPSMHQKFEPSFMGCAVVTEDRRERFAIKELKQYVLRRINLVAQRGASMIDAYDQAFAALTLGDPGPFRDFLLDAPAKFIPLGEATGAVKHIYSFWGFRFPENAALSLEASEALDILQEFDRMLNGIQLISAAPPETVMIA